MASPQLFTLVHGSTIDSTKNGMFGVIGDAGHGITAGAIAIQFMPNGTWAGSLSVQGRVGGGPLSKQDNQVPVPFAPVPFRKVILNGVVSLYEMVNDSGGALITSASLVHVPATGLSIALLVSCTAGSGTFAIRTLEGCGAP